MLRGFQHWAENFLIKACACLQLLQIPAVFFIKCFPCGEVWDVEGSSIDAHICSVKFPIGFNW